MTATPLAATIVYVMKHKFVVGLVSVGTILFSAGLTYFALAALLLRDLTTTDSIPFAETACEPEPIGGQLVVIFEDDITEQMQGRIAMAQNGIVESQTHLDSFNQYRTIIKIDSGKEQQTIAALRTTPGVVLAEQDNSTCPF